MTTTVTEDTFLEMVQPLRRELVAHCYRMVGSVQEAEDLVQETYLRAWRSFHGFENRSSVRTWMYRIATNTCLTALEGRSRRPLPTGLGAPPGDPTAELRTRPEVSWLEPLPDAVVWGAAPADPGDVALARDTVRLAFVAALQHLTAQQRAALLLKDVLCWQASEIAEALGLSVASVNSSLQRARAHLAKLDEDATPRLADDDPRLRHLLDAYVEAFEAYDVQRIVQLLTADAEWEMPPFEEWYRGAEDIGRLIRTQCPAQAAGDMRLLLTRANGAPAVGMYMRGPDGVHRAFQLQHLTVTPDGVSAVTVWFDTDLFRRFGLPDHLGPEGEVAALAPGEAPHCGL
ncbi:sigma-70 family RNA polymerase sigma factor [Actinotalea sp. Marseille-Q4924]|uniref:sigma-70 family RNA polymerase sigma factor n=1 Tax=Actinotalea sp. Marseille-Q4924 TaxID=2866571 RepID=UPI001CE49338|nr:sigma-70 family RNA polymerase sigma factor [Actinotalea sp. Marseille-Q4924]